MLRESKGNMYPFVTHTWNPIKGRCAHGCEYCYMRRFPLGELRLDEKDLRTKLVDPKTGEQGLFIFVGSSTDMWAEGVPLEWINRVIHRCHEYPGNGYLFQSKNPGRFPFYLDIENLVYGTTIETNRWYPCMGKAPHPDLRAMRMFNLERRGRRTMITIEPILDFDLPNLVAMIETARPEWVNIGADSKGHNLPEPPPEKVWVLIERLREFTTVKLKSNLARITGPWRKEFPG